MRRAAVAAFWVVALAGYVALGHWSTAGGGARQKIQLTGPVSSSTWTIPAAVADWQLKVCQDSTGGRAIVWPTSPAITWVGGSAPTLSTTALACDFFGLILRPVIQKSDARAAEALRALRCQR